MQMIGGNGGNQVRQYAGNLNGYNEVQNVRNQVAQNPIVQNKEEAGIQLQAEEYDLMAAVADLDETEEVNANCILMANLQQASSSGTQTDNTPIYDSDGSAETDDELTENELKQIEANDQAIQTILFGLPEDIYAAVDSCETAQEIWLRVQQMMKGSDIGIQGKKAKLFNEWERFNSNERELIESYYHQWSRHVTIVHQTKDLHTADYTQLYDFLKYNQNEVDELKAERLAKIQDPLALMANSNNPYAFLAPHQDQPSFNQNYTQQPILNSEDITDPTTAINMALALMAKAFKLNYSTPTNNNQRISSNPHNRHIAQPGNLTGYNDVQNIGNQASTSGTQSNNAPIYDLDRSAEVHDYENYDDNEIFNMFTQEEQYTELLKPIPEQHQVPQNDNNVIFEVTSGEQDGETVEQHPANFEETHALYDSLYHNLAIEVEKVNSVNHKLKETNADLTTELARFKTQEKCFEISQEKYNKLERCYQQNNYQKLQVRSFLTALAVEATAAAGPAATATGPAPTPTSGASFPTAAAPAEIAVDTFATLSATEEACISPAATEAAFPALSLITSGDTAVEESDSDIEDVYAKTAQFMTSGGANDIYRRLLYSGDDFIVYLWEGYDVKIIDVLALIKDEEKFSKVSDKDEIRLCLLLSLEVIFIGRELVSVVDDALLRMVDNLDTWNTFPWESSCESDCWWTKVPEVIPRAVAWTRKAEIFKLEYFGELFHKAPIELAPTKAKFQSNWYTPSYDFLCGIPSMVFEDETVLEEKTHVVLKETGVFEKKNIDPAKYKISFRHADDVPKQGGVFGDCDVFLCMFLYRLAYGVPLAVDDPVQAALAYCEKMIHFYFKHKMFCP
nr:phospholipase-like protein [Tanacetum cinerariifolium]